MQGNHSVQEYDNAQCQQKLGSIDFLKREKSVEVVWVTR